MDKNKNFKMVKVKEDRACSWCENTIHSGEKALSVNPKYQGRQWVCTNCLTALEKVIKEKEREGLIPFDDEGAEYLQQENITEAKGDLLNRVTNPFIRDRFMRVL